MCGCHEFRGTTTARQRGTELRVGGPPLGAENLFEAARCYDALVAPYEAARATEHAAGLLFDAGHASKAGRLLRVALDGYGRLGASWDHARAARTARLHGMTLPRRHGGGRRSYGPALSPQERKVAELAATGRTNKQIAAELFISHRTVDKHLGAVMRKLGTGSRTALAHKLASVEPADDSKDGQDTP